MDKWTHQSSHMATVKTVVTTETILRKKRWKRCSADIPAQREAHLNVLEGVLGDVTPAGKGPKPDDDHDGGANVQQSAVPNRYWCPCSHFLSVLLSQRRRLPSVSTTNQAPSTSQPTTVAQKCRPRLVEIRCGQSDDFFA